MARPRKNTFVKLYELKRGEKFYYGDKVYIFWDCIYNGNNPNQIQIRLRPMYGGSRKFCQTMFINGHNVGEVEYLRYTGRDRSSFIAGFKHAMDICTKNMGIFDIQNAELDNPIHVHMTMLNEYEKWKKNLDES